ACTNQSFSAARRASSSVETLIVPSVSFSVLGTGAPLSLARLRHSSTSCREVSNCPSSTIEFIRSHGTESAATMIRITAAPNSKRHLCSSEIPRHMTRKCRGQRPARLTSSGKSRYRESRGCKYLVYVCAKDQLRISLNGNTVQPVGDLLGATQ